MCENKNLKLIFILMELSNRLGRLDKYLVMSKVRVLSNLKLAYSILLGVYNISTKIRPSSHSVSVIQLLVCSLDVLFFRCFVLTTVLVKKTMIWIANPSYLDPE